jgi:hypothetical protein
VGRGIEAAGSGQASTHGSELRLRVGKLLPQGVVLGVGFAQRRLGGAPAVALATQALDRNTSRCHGAAQCSVGAVFCQPSDLARVIAITTLFGVVITAPFDPFGVMTAALPSGIG